MLPHITLFNAMSIDGRLDHLEGESALYQSYYDLASQWETDAILMGSETILKGFNASNGEIRGDVIKVREKREKFSPDNRPLLVVPDSSGKIGVWSEVLEMPFIKDILVLCSNSTPPEYLGFLEINEIEYLVDGADKVDFKSVLAKLKEFYDINRIRVDSGGTLNGILLRESLVDELKILINPCLTGGISPSSIFQAPDLKSSNDLIKLKLSHFEKMKGDMIYLHYQVEK